MKKMFAFAVVAALAFSANAFAADKTTGNVEVKKSTETTSAGVTTTKTEVKNTATGTKATNETITSGDTTAEKTTLKSKNVKVENEKVVTPTAAAGEVKFEAKKGAIDNMKIDWMYTMEGKDYVIQYTIKDKTNKDLLKELNLTADQASAITPGTHKIVSTSPYTADDVRNNMRAVIIKDLQNNVKTKSTK